MSGQVVLQLEGRTASRRPRQSLTARLHRVRQERGHLRNLTEAALVQRIAQKEQVRREAGTEADADTDSSFSEDEGKEDTVEDPAVKLQQTRDKLLLDISSAQTEAMAALDLLSLVISGEKPQQAGIAMSPYLRENIPLGSMSAVILEDRDTGMVASAQDSAASQVTANSLLEAADFLSTISERLAMRNDNR